MNLDRHRLQKVWVRGFWKGLRSFLWVVEILIPISLFTALLQWSGWINYLDLFLRPAMGWLHLPAMAAVPLTIALCTGIYGGIAAMTVLPFSQGQMTLMAIFMLIAHSLIQETVIQAKSGLHPFKAIPFRLCCAILTVLAVAPFLDTTQETIASSAPAVPFSLPFLAMLSDWSISMLSLSSKIFLLVMSILILLEILKALDVIHLIVRTLAPVLRLLGLDERVGIPWIAGAFFGLVYGSAVILEEAREGHLKREELERLQLSIGINHSMIEDPALFLSLGLSPFWLWVPRLLMAMLAVRLLNLWHRSRKNSARKEQP